MLNEKAVPCQDKLAIVHTALWRRQQVLYLAYWISSPFINLFVLQISKHWYSCAFSDWWKSCLIDNPSIKKLQFHLSNKKKKKKSPKGAGPPLQQHHWLTVLGTHEEPSQGRVAPCILPARPVEKGILPSTGQQHWGRNPVGYATWLHSSVGAGAYTLVWGIQVLLTTHS